ncbi:LytR/AlgR family response regulator transcription factor [Ruminiclostridium cellobioparum]|uniref:Stage 0 sporulation protein A homolog n=1 Tax=Ruminiclostridium cellobioparum subsp. termitidis CT1112 TaxID=1195236 RepID=S0FGX0_RUMCE|nr:LytTR family DNA-binding domain-containing protein [Ruminiclostridium cellobioparum]EMS69031.1 Response regulator of the LytR/AlgR family [Ruminiclostridium cellobioparum subsp. termitidis CT1112]
MLNVAVCDDDKNFLDEILREAKKVFYNLRTEVSIHAFTDSDKLISSFEKYKPYYDIVFLEINMPPVNGTDVAAKLRVLNKNFKLILISAYVEEAINTFQYDISAFLPKTSIHEKMPELIERLVKEIDNENLLMHVFKVEDVNGRIKIVKVSLSDIMYFESVCRKVYIHTSREKFILHGYQFSAILEQFISKGFVCIHRTCIVNIKYIFSIDEVEVTLDNGTRLPVSRRKRQLIITRLSEIVNIKN